MLISQTFFECFSHSCAPLAYGSDLGFKDGVKQDCSFHVYNVSLCPGLDSDMQAFGMMSPMDKLHHDALSAYTNLQCHSPEESKSEIGDQASSVLPC